MADPHELRAVDDDRESTLALLRTATADGRLTVQELAERADRVRRARTHGDLSAATARLAPAAPPAREQVRDRALLCRRVRAGRWRLARRNRFEAVLATLRIDLREAVLPGAEVEIEVRCLLGSAEVLLPEGAEVHVTGRGALCRDEVRLQGEAPAGAPVIRIHHGGALGAFAVRTRPRLFAR